MDEQRALDGGGWSSLVGRDVELTALAAGLEDAIVGRGRLLLIASSPGRLGCAAGTERPPLTPSAPA